MKVTSKVNKRSVTDGHNINNSIEIGDRVIIMKVTCHNESNK